MRLSNSPDAEVSIRKQDASKLPQFAGVKLPSALSKAMSQQQHRANSPSASTSQRTPEPSPEQSSQQSPPHPSEFTVLAQRLGSIHLRTPAIGGSHATPAPKVKPARLDFDAALTPQQDKENVDTNSNAPSVEAEKLALAAGKLSLSSGKAEKPNSTLNVMSAQVPPLSMSEITPVLSEPSPMVIAQTPAIPRDVLGDALQVIEKHRDTPQSWQKLCYALSFVERTLYEKAGTTPAIAQRVANGIAPITAALARCIGSYQPQVIQSALKLVNALVLTNVSRNTSLISRLFDDIADLATSKSVTAREAALTMVTFILAEPSVAPKLRNTQSIERMVQHLRSEFKSGNHSAGKTNMIKQAIDIVIANAPSMASTGSPSDHSSFTSPPVPQASPLSGGQSSHTPTVSPETPSSRQIMSATRVRNASPPSPPNAPATLPRNKRLSSTRTPRRISPKEMHKVLKFSQEDMDEARRMAIEQAQNELSSNGKKYSDIDLANARQEGQTKAMQEFQSSDCKFTQADLDAARQLALTEASEQTKDSPMQYTEDDLEKAANEARDKALLTIKSLGKEYSEADLESARAEAQRKALADLAEAGKSFTEADLTSARQEGFDEANKLLFKQVDIEKARAEGAEEERNQAKSSGLVFTQTDVDKARQDAVEEAKASGNIISDSEIEKIRQEALESAKANKNLFTEADLKKARDQAFSNAKSELSEEAAKSNLRFTQEDIDAARKEALEEAKRTIDPSKKYTEGDLKQACEKAANEAKEVSKAETMDIAQGIAEGLAQTEIAELKKKLQAEKKEKEEFHAVFAEYDRTMKEMADGNMDSQNHGLLDAEVSRLKNELFEATDAFNKMKDRYTESKEVIAVMEGKETRVVEQNHQLRQSLVELQSWCNELKANSEKKLAKAFENVSHYRSTYLDREAHAKKALSELKSTKQELEQSRQTCSELSNKLASVELQLHTSQDEATGLKAALNEMRTEYQQATSECNSLREDAGAAKAALIKVQKELDQLKESQSDAAQAVDKANSLQTETRALKASAYDYMSRNRNLEKQLQEKESECKELNGICEELIVALEAEKQKSH